MAWRLHGAVHEGALGRLLEEEPIILVIDDFSDVDGVELCVFANARSVRACILVPLRIVIILVLQSGVGLSLVK